MGRGGCGGRGWASGDGTHGGPEHSDVWWVLLVLAVSLWATRGRGVRGWPGHFTSRVAQKRECILLRGLTALWCPVALGQPPPGLNASGKAPHLPRWQAHLSASAQRLWGALWVPPTLCSTQSPLIPQARACLALHREGKTILKNAGPRRLVFPAQICPLKTCLPAPGEACLSESPASPWWAS